MREDKAITMILSNVTWYRADEVLPDTLPEDTPWTIEYSDSHTYLCVMESGWVTDLCWFNGWNKRPGNKNNDITEITDVVLWAEMPNGKELLKEVSPNDDM